MAKKSKKGLSTKLKKLLGVASKKFKKVDAASGSGFVNEAVDDGGYTATLVGGELTELGGKGCVVLTYEISGDKDGDDCDANEEKVSSRYFLETEQNLAYLKRDLGRFIDDVDEVDLSESLESTLEAMVEAEPECKIFVKMAGEFQNVYLNKVDVDGGGSDEDDEDDDDEDDDDDDKKKKGKKKGKTASGGKGGKKGGKKSSKDEDDDDEDDDDEDDDDEDEDDDEDGGEIEEGDTVSFKPPRAKKPRKCKVIKVKGEKATLEDEDGNEFKGIKLDVLELVDEDDDEDDDDDDEDDEDDDDDDKKKKKKGKKKKGKKDDDDEDDDDEDDDDEDTDDETEVEVGSKVSVTHKGKEYTGKVKSLDEDDETIEVRFKVGKEYIVKTFPADKVEAA